MSNKYCKNCGKEFYKGDQYCYHCGHKIEVSSATTLDKNIQTSNNKTITNSTSQIFNKKRLALILIPILLLGGILYWFFNPHFSKVKGISNEVYYQLVEHYFYAETFMDFTENGEGKEFVEWVEEQEQYKDAEKYAEKNDIFASSMAFPNPLIMEYYGEKREFSATEKKYIEKIIELQKTFTLYDNEKFDELSKELKEELKIIDSYNPFEY